tara:strand:- start:306 stop:542 length:237 start_codon:yes stop_codon:yes gene_type:complete
MGIKRYRHAIAMGLQCRHLFLQHNIHAFVAQACVYQRCRALIDLSREQTMAALQKGHVALTREQCIGNLQTEQSSSNY